MRGQPLFYPELPYNQTSARSSCQACGPRRPSPRPRRGDVAGILVEHDRLQHAAHDLPRASSAASPTKFRSPMTATAPSSRRTVWSSSVRSSSDGWFPASGRRTLRSPRRELVGPPVPASATAGCFRNALSTSIVPMRWAAILITSSARPATQTYRPRRSRPSRPCSRRSARGCFPVVRRPPLGLAPERRGQARERPAHNEDPLLPGRNSRLQESSSPPSCPAAARRKTPAYRDHPEPVRIADHRAAGLRLPPVSITGMRSSNTSFCSHSQAGGFSTPRTEDPRERRESAVAGRRRTA